MNKLRSQGRKTKATAFLYIGLAILLALINLYAYMADSAIAGVLMPQIEPDVENAVIRETSTIDYFPRNMVIVQLIVIVACVAYMKLSAKEYKIGLTFPEHKVGFAFTIIALVVAVFYALIQLSWKGAGYLYVGLIAVLSIVSGSLFMALGVYLFRRAEMGRVAKLLIPMICGAAQMIVGFIYEVLFIQNFLVPYPFVTLTMSTITIMMIVSAILIAFFTIVFYLKTNLLSVPILVSLIWGVAVTSFPLSSMADQKPIISSDHTLEYTGFNELYVIKSGGFTEVVAFLGAIAIFVVSVVLLIKLIRERRNDYASDVVAGYVPLEPSADEITDCKGLLKSSKTLLLAICSVISLGYLVFSCLSDHAVDISDFMISGLDGLFNHNVGAFFLALGGIVVFAAALALIGAFVIGLFLFYQARKKARSRKIKAAWIFTKIFVCASIALDLTVAVLVFVLGFGKFLSTLPVDFYLWNSLLSDLVTALNSTILAGEIPSIVFSLIVAVVMLIFAAYHTASLFLVLSFEKNNGEAIRGKFLYKAVYVMTVVFALALILMAPWFYQALDTCVAILAGVTMLLFASTLRSIAK